MAHFKVSKSIILFWKCSLDILSHTQQKGLIQAKFCLQKHTKSFSSGLQSPVPCFPKKAHHIMLFIDYLASGFNPIISTGIFFTELHSLYNFRSPNLGSYLWLLNICFFLVPIVSFNSDYSIFPGFHIHPSSHPSLSHPLHPTQSSHDLSVFVVARLNKLCSSMVVLHQHNPVEGNRFTLL